jgi:ferredoxin
MHKKFVQTEADSIVIVFPAYLAQLNGIPLIVKRFIGKLDNLSKKRIFPVVTCGGYESFNALPTLRNFSRAVRLKGGKLFAEYSIRLPMNTLDYSHIPVPINKDHETMFRNCEKKVEQICEAIAHGNKGHIKIAKLVLNWLMAPLYLLLQTAYYKELRKFAKEPVGSKLSYVDLIPLTDKSIYIDEKCNGCAICADICPAENIVMERGKPTWIHHCEMCLACSEWCPSQAIHHGGRADGRYYHHPAIKLSDMQKQARAIREVLEADP